MWPEKQKVRLDRNIHLSREVQLGKVRANSATEVSLQNYLHATESGVDTYCRFSEPTREPQGTRWSLTICRTFAT